MRRRSMCPAALHPRWPLALLVLGVLLGPSSVFAQLPQVRPVATTEQPPQGGFGLGAAIWVLSSAVVLTTNPDRRELGLFSVDPQTYALTPLLAEVTTMDGALSSGALSLSADAERLYAYAAGPLGTVRQWELVPAGGGRVVAEPVRAFALASEVAGLVVDEATQRLYVAESARGIWRFSAPASAARWWPRWEAGCCSTRWGGSASTR
jgi:hypothetical protein